MQPSPWTGRLAAAPADLLHDEILGPQFRFEKTHLLRWYVEIEKTLAAEYVRMGVIEAGDAARIARTLADAPTALADADPVANLSDIAFALERHVEPVTRSSVPAWHVDRSRNDLQATAQRLFLRETLRDVAAAVADLCDIVMAKAGETAALPMPGYTHFQPAQVSTPGFHLAALSGTLLHSLRRLLHTESLLDACPLGAGAMTGQILPWDRARMAALLGFARVEAHALTSVASRRSVAEATAEYSLLGVELSRFVTDLIAWTGGDCRYAELPDELAGISSAMPQKKNYPVLERIRGRTAHLAAFHADAVLGQRNTPYTNLVEVSKEAGSYAYEAGRTALVVLRLLGAVVAGLRFDAGRMRAACDAEFLGGFALADRLTLHEGIPWRRAQVIAGRYVVAALAAGHAPGDHAADLLRAAADPLPVAGAEEHLAAAFDTDAGLTALSTAGSAHPDRVGALLADQRADLADQRAELDRRRAGALAAATRLDAILQA